MTQALQAQIHVCARGHGLDEASTHQPRGLIHISYFLREYLVCHYDNNPERLAALLAELPPEASNG